MSDILLMAGVAAVAFVSTNLDNLFLLMGLVSDGRTPTRQVALGYVAAIATVLAISVAGSYAFDLAADRWLRFLGVVPLGMGVWRIRRMLARAETGAEAAPVEGIGVASVFGVMLANSGDSLGVFTSLMGETRQPLVFVIAGTSLALAALWAVAARWVVAHPVLAPRLRALDRWVVPFFLVAIGAYIIVDTSTDTV